MLSITVGIPTVPQNLLLGIAIIVAMLNTHGSKTSEMQSFWDGGLDNYQAGLDMVKVYVVCRKFSVERSRRMKKISVGRSKECGCTW